eukprot:CAMPEP_0195305750 /NCGR_PEP_ID=MMETSP0707-20130614/36847_1 /TAXON_ID=33640 /ORGANISM="Asterionellopsis glacialis, Strain CCMP134" /LENGTH=829 /DNA_ID=CAMNT_0040369951 /DNA_START=167 /DNA_END=2656 /DNA_ORIENTATION=+
MSMLVPPPSRDKGTTRSARRSKDGSNSLGKDVPHVIRATVLGLAGVTVDQSLCREGAKGAKPPLPAKMRAVVAFSRSATIHGTTCLSRPLTLSPKDDIVHSARPASNQTSGASAFSGEKVEVKDLTKGRTTRHVAVWASGEKTLGSEVTFETPLHRSNKSSTSTTASSAFAPKSFELLVALTEDTDEESKIAIPLGVASLAVSGDECLNGQSVTLDLPVMSLRQARPLASNKNGTVGFPLISISKKSSKDQKGENMKRASSFKRFFKNKTPSVSERKGFASAYSMDAAGDAIIRISLDLAAKGSPLDSVFEARRQKAKAKKATSTKNKVDSKKTNKKKDAKESPKPSKVKKIVTEEDMPNLPPPRNRSRSQSRARSQSRTRSQSRPRSQSRTRSRSPASNTTPLADEYDDDSDSDSSSDDESWTVGSATFTDCDSANDEEILSMMDSSLANRDASGGGCHFNGFMQRNDTYDDYTNDGTQEGHLTFAQKCQGQIIHEDDFTTVSAKIFGQKFKVPICSVLADDSDDESDTRKPSVVHLGEPPSEDVTDEERTLLSTTIFGQSIKLKVPGSHQSSNGASGRTSRRKHISGGKDDLCKSPALIKTSNKLSREGSTQDSTLTESLTTRSEASTESESAEKRSSRRSPKGVTEFEEHNHSPRRKGSQHTDSYEDSGEATMLDTVKAMLFGNQCGPIVLNKESSRRSKDRPDTKYPTVIIPAEDESTVGELTVTTLEKKLMRNRTPPVQQGKPFRKNRSGNSFKAPAHEKDYFLEYDKMKPVDMLHQRSAKSNKSNKSNKSQRSKKSQKSHGSSQNSAKYFSVEKSRECNLAEI